MIEFHTADIEYAIVDHGSITAWLSMVAITNNTRINHINYIFCSDPFLRKINKEHLDHDYFTDIITFPLSTVNGLEADIYISIDRVRENAEVYGQKEHEELRRVLVHGLLHLLGFDDHTQKDRDLMRKEEDRWLNQYSS